MSAIDNAIDTASLALMDRLDQLAAFSAETGRLTRLYLTPEYHRAGLQIMRWMEEAGLTTRIDALGNVVGRYEGKTAGLPALLLGSHFDTVRDAGKYDGPLGILASIQAVALLHARNIRLDYAIEILAMGNEEGVRFPVALTGSTALAGVFDPAQLDAADNAGILLRDALAALNLPPLDDPAALAYRRDAVLAYVELHIEQGPVLEAENLPVGIVSAMAGTERYQVQVDGFAGHAGTVPMPLRRDALCAGAEMILAAETLARQTPDLLATIGTIAASPGAVNVIPAATNFSLDIRSSRDAIRQLSVGTLLRTWQSIADRRRVQFAARKVHEAPAAECSPKLVKALSASFRRAGIPPRLLPSGAGHDGQAMASLCPIAMIFLRCRGGISHNPAESITRADAGIALAILLDFLQHLGPQDLKVPS